MIRQTSSPELSSVQGSADQLPQAHGRLGFITFWSTAVLILFWQLGSSYLKGSEGRWAEIGRNMLLPGDLFHPIINNEVYLEEIYSCINFF